MILIERIHGQCPRPNSLYIKNDTKWLHLCFLFQNAFIGNVAITIYGDIDALVWQVSVLKMYLLNTLLNFHIKSFNYFCFLFASWNNLSEVYDRKINTTFFISSQLDWVSGWYGKGRINLFLKDVINTLGYLWFTWQYIHTLIGKIFPWNDTLTQQLKVKNIMFFRHGQKQGR